MSADLEIDQQLKIKGAAVQGPVEYVLDGMRIHVVQPGEGLYAIARQYEVTVDDLVEWNELTSSALNLGQEVIVGKVGATPKTSVVMTPVMTTTVDEPFEEPVAESSTTEETTMVEESSSENYSNKPPVKKVQRKEDGLAAAIEGGVEDNTFLAMHRTISVGSLVAVRNEMNQQVVFVRVVGALPDTGINDKIIIRLSASAVAQLQAIDPKFRVEITYLIPEEE